MNDENAKNLWPIFALVVEMGNVGDDMGRDKGAKRYLHLMDLFDELLALGKVDFSKVKDNFKNLTDEGRDWLKAQAKDKFDIESDALEAAIEEGLDILESQYEVVEKSIALAKRLKQSA